MTAQSAAGGRRTLANITAGVLVSLTALVLSSRALSAQVGATSLASRWTPATLFPPGALLSVVSGNPAAPGQSIAELFLPDGYRVPAHFHPMDEGLEIRQGTLLVGTGDRQDIGETVELRAGDTAIAPADMHHSWVARGPTVVALTFNGPYTITYVHAHEAPRRKVFPYGY